MTETSQNQVVQKFVGGPFLSANRRVWKYLPKSATTTAPGHAYGNFLHSLVCRFSDRTQYHGTFFLRNRPELKLMSDLAAGRASDGKVKIAVLGCSNGAEVYSIVWTLRTLHPELTLSVYAADISGDILAIAKAGVYSLGTNELMDAEIFERLSPEEMRSMFDVEGERATVKSWMRQGIEFAVEDAGDFGLVDRLGTQQIVVANRFLCHMAPPDAERCLRNLARLVAPGGYLFVSGVDLDVRTKVARDLHWAPMPDLIEEIHDGDPSVRGDWPWKWWGLEPLNQSRRDWKIRYASVFRIGGGA